MAAAGAGRRRRRSDEERSRAGVRAFLQTLADYPESAQTLLVEIIGAGPRAAARRDAILEALRRRPVPRQPARRPRATARRRSPRRDDAFAIIGASVELVSRQLRTGQPADMRALEPVIARLMLGALDRAR